MGRCSRGVASAAVAVLYVWLCTASQAAEEIRPKVIEASLFKNGLAVVLRSVEIPGAGQYVIRELPRALHGGLWLASEDKDLVVEQAIASRVTTATPTRARDLHQLLLANVGKAVEVRTSDGWLSGAVLALPAEPRNGTGGAIAAAVASPVDYVLLQTATGTVAVPPRDVLGVRASGGELAVDYAAESPGTRLELKVTGKGGVLEMLTVEQGMTWAPSYRVMVQSDEEASVVCNAVVLNDTTDLQDATVNLVTGFPNIRFTGTVSPLTMSGDILAFLSSLDTAERWRAEAGVTVQQVAMNVADTSGVSQVPIPAGIGEEVGDLFLYPQPHVTLAVGDRAYYPVFAKRVPCRSLYVWDVGAAPEGREPWRRRELDSGSSQKEEVWHCLRLTNSGGLPWTTAPAMTTQDGRVLGQDILRYTAPGGEALLRVTQAVQIGAEQLEVETEREPGGYKAGRDSYDIVHVRGTLRVNNHKATAVELRITRTLEGQVSESQPKAEVTTLASGIGNVNPTQKVTWEVTVAANEAKDLTYDYKYYSSR